VLFDGDPQFSRRCPSREVIEYYANAMKQWMVGALDGVASHRNTHP
jgi:hypothetical protein